MVHKLKILPEYFNAVISGKKTFEIRKNDRPFHEGDLLALNEFDGQSYTGRRLTVVVTYIMDDADYCKNDMVVMSIKRLEIFYETCLGREVLCDNSEPCKTREVGGE